MRETTFCEVCGEDVVETQSGRIRGCPHYPPSIGWAKSMPLSTPGARKRGVSEEALEWGKVMREIEDIEEEKRLQRELGEVWD